MLVRADQSPTNGNDQDRSPRSLAEPFGLPSARPAQWCAGPVTVQYHLPGDELARLASRSNRAQFHPGGLSEWPKEMVLKTIVR